MRAQACMVPLAGRSPLVTVSVHEWVEEAKPFVQPLRRWIGLRPARLDRPLTAFHSGIATICIFWEWHTRIKDIQGQWQESHLKIFLPIYCGRSPLSSIDFLPTFLQQQGLGWGWSWQAKEVSPEGKASNLSPQCYLLWSAEAEAGVRAC